MPNPRESSIAIVRFSGKQQTSLRVHSPKTSEAQVAINIGHVLIYAHAATPLLKLRYGLSRINMQQLQRGTQPLAARPLTISAELQEADAASVHLMQRPGTPAFVRIQLGQLALDAVDRDAFVCLAQTLQTAAMLAEEHFLDHPDLIAPVVPIGVRGDNGLVRSLRAE